MALKHMNFIFYCCVFVQFHIIMFIFTSLLHRCTALQHESGLFPESDFRNCRISKVFQSFSKVFKGKYFEIISFIEHWTSHIYTLHIFTLFRLNWTKRPTCKDKEKDKSRSKDKDKTILKNPRLWALDSRLETSDLLWKMKTEINNHNIFKWPFS